MKFVSKIRLFVAVIGIASFAAEAQTGIVHYSSQDDAEIYSYGCLDYASFEEFFKANRNNDSKQKQALVKEEWCFFVSGMEYSLIENLGNLFSRVPGGVSDVRVYASDNSDFADYGESLELVVANKYLHDYAEEKEKRYSNYNIVDGLIPFKIWNREEVGSAKVSFDVAVPIIDDRLPTKQELGSISKYLVSNESKHDQSFVSFYLPEMQVGAGAFATAHHNPNMEVVVNTIMLYAYREYRKFAN